MPATCHEYRYEARRFAATAVGWRTVTEEFVCEKLAVGTPDGRELNDILIAMRNGAEADAEGFVFRTVPVAGKSDLRVVYTTAPANHDGFGTVVLSEVAGTDNQGRTIRKVGIRPDHYDWQTQRYASGLHAAVGEDEIERYTGIFAGIWTMAKEGKNMKAAAAYIAAAEAAYAAAYAATYAAATAADTDATRAATAATSAYAAATAAREKTLERRANIVSRNQAPSQETVQ